MRATFELDGVCLRLPDGGGDLVAAATSTSRRRCGCRSPAPSASRSANSRSSGGALSADEQRVLRVVADQLSVALTTRRLAAGAAEAATLAEVDAVRTAMLRSVSHDLRSPLASIKAMVSGPARPGRALDARRSSTTRSPRSRTETDRLNRLVGNLLDASRLQIGALATAARPTPLVEVVDAAVARGRRRGRRQRGRLPDDLPLVDADPVLLERALANVLANALPVQPAPARAGAHRRRGARRRRPPARRRPRPGHRRGPPRARCSSRSSASATSAAATASASA